MKKIIITILIIALVLLAGFYFKDNILRIYEDFTKKIEKFQKIDFNSVVEGIEKQVFAPSPLRVDNPQSNVVLTKSGVISETNKQREKNGLSSLTENKKLSNAALAKANDIFAKQYFDHVSPSSIGPAELVKGYGYDYIITGENLILGNFSSEKEMVDAWMASPGHRANILNARYIEIGVALVKGVFEGQSVWVGVQEFGLPLSVCSEPDTNLENQITSRRAELDTLASQIDNMRSQIDNTDPYSSTYNQLVNDYNQLVAQYGVLAEELKTTIATYNEQVINFNQCVTGK